MFFKNNFLSLQTYVVTTKYFGVDSYQMHYRPMKYVYMHTLVLHKTFGPVLLQLLVFYPGKAFKASFY